MSSNIKLAHGIKTAYDHEVELLETTLAARDATISKLVATAAETKNYDTLAADIQAAIGQSVQSILTGAQAAMPGKQATFDAYVASYKLSADGVQNANTAITNIANAGNDKVKTILGAVIQESMTSFGAAAVAIKNLPQDANTVEAAKKLIQATEDANAKSWQSFYTQSFVHDMDTVHQIVHAVADIASPAAPKAN